MPASSLFLGLSPAVSSTWKNTYSSSYPPSPCNVSKAQGHLPEETLPGGPQVDPVPSNSLGLAPGSWTFVRQKEHYRVGESPWMACSCSSYFSHRINTKKMRPQPPRCCVGFAKAGEAAKQQQLSPDLPPLHVPLTHWRKTSTPSGPLPYFITLIN